MRLRQHRFRCEGDMRHLPPKDREEKRCYAKGNKQSSPAAPAAPGANEHEKCIEPNTRFDHEFSARAAPMQLISSGGYDTSRYDTGSDDQDKSRKRWPS